MRFQRDIAHRKIDRLKTDNIVRKIAALK